MYLLLKDIHIAAIATSITLFAVRGALMLAESARLRTPLMRVLPHVIDTILLASGVGLIALLGTVLLSQTWLQVKLTLVLAYIVTGSVALKRGKTYRARAMALIIALLIVALIIATALAHRPLGLPVS